MFYQKASKPTKTSKSDHSFHNTVPNKKPCWGYLTNLNSLNIVKNILPPAAQSNTLLNLQIFQQKCFWLVSEKRICDLPFLDVQEIHFQGTWQENVCIFLYISVRKLLFQRRRKLLSGGGLNNFLKIARCFGLEKCFKNFNFN